MRQRAAGHRVESAALCLAAALVATGCRAETPVPPPHSAPPLDATVVVQPGSIPSPAATPPAATAPQPASTASDATLATSVPASPTAVLVGSASGGALGDIYELRAVRAAVHDGGARWRIVWEFYAAKGMPAYEIQERSAISEPQGSPFGGRSYLEVTLHDVYLRELETNLPLTTVPGAFLTEVALLPLADDAMVRFGVGLADAAPFAVFEESDPARLVLDVYASTP